MRGRNVALIAAIVIALAGCSGNGDTPADEGAQEPMSTSSEAGTSSAPVSADSVCSAFFDTPPGLEFEDTLAMRIPDMLTNMPAEMDAAAAVEYSKIDTRLEVLTLRAPDELLEPLETVRAPFADVTEVVENGGGSLSSDTSHVSDAMATITAVCADSGFKVEQADTDPSAEAGADTDLPSREDMKPEERILAEAVFADQVRGDGGFDAYTDQELVDAGDAVCDAMDRGDSLQSVLIVAAGLLPSARDTEAIAYLAGTASGTLCPEHADYVS